MKKITILFVLLIALNTNAQNNIKINIAKNFVLHAAYNTSMKMNMMGKKADMNTNMYITGVVDSVVNNNIYWSFTTDSSKLISKQGGENKNFNSNDTATYKNAPPQFYENVGKKLQVTMTDNGEIIDSLNTVDETIKNAFINYAHIPKNKKETWTEDRNINAMGNSINISAEFNIEKEDEKTMTIKSKTSAEMIGKPIETIYIIDKKTGLVKSSTATMEMKMMGSLKTSNLYQANW